MKIELDRINKKFEREIFDSRWFATYYSVGRRILGLTIDATRTPTNDVTWWSIKEFINEK
jgi:hypothetical protein